MSIRPVRISASRRRSAGRSRLPPENPVFLGDPAYHRELMLQNWTA
jgi:hypothetical protein